MLTPEAEGVVGAINRAHEYAAAGTGRVLFDQFEDEAGVEGPVVSIDGVQLQELDYVDVGELISPPGVVPVVIKSLIFPTSAATGTDWQPAPRAIGVILSGGNIALGDFRRLTAPRGEGSRAEGARA